MLVNPMLKNLWIIFIFLVGCTTQIAIEKPQQKPTPEPTPQLIATGIFNTPSVKGSVSLVLEKDRYKLLLNDLRAKLTPDLRLYLVTTTNEKIEVHKFEEEPVGDFTFELPITDISTIAAVDLYCVYCELSFGKATLVKQ